MDRGLGSFFRYPSSAFSLKGQKARTNEFFDY